MKKRFRLLIILAVLVIAGAFLYPTYNWYLQVSEQKKELSTSSNTQIKEYAEKKAYEGKKILQDLLIKPFEASELTKVKGLLQTIKESKDPFVLYVKEKMSSSTVSAINSADINSPVSESLRKSLADDLNALMNGVLIYDPGLFKDIKLSVKTKKLADDQYSAEGDYTAGEYKAVNRLLLQEAFPGNGLGVELPEDFAFVIPNIKKYYQSLKLAEPAVKTVRDALFSFIREADLIELFEDHYRDEILALKDVRRGTIQLGLDLSGGMRVTVQADFEQFAADQGKSVSELTDEEKEKAMERVLLILNNRIDQFGVTEPQIRTQSNDRILIELPGLADPERIRSIIMGKGRLNFHIVNNEGTQAFNEYYQKMGPAAVGPDGQPSDPSIIPPDTVLRELIEKDKYGLDERVGYVVINKEIGLSGNYIQDASVVTDPITLKPRVTFQLSDEGGKKFYDLTSANVDNQLAVVLDDKVKLNANISTAIRDQVSVSGQGIGATEANDLATVLKTGALPVPIEIIAESDVGASLGEDAIKQGLQAMGLGIVLVIVFMLVYYRGGGIIANLAMFLNFFLMAGFLSVFGFTLTLPSIAGFILTVGMAVDANVIIFERIKDEYRMGKSRKAAIQSGFSKAFRAIFDANITTMIAAFALAAFGLGQIVGFAIVLIIGIVSSMFTALFVARLLFDYVTDSFKAKRLSLSWRGSK